MMQELTEDAILNGKIKLLQPKVGYRVAIDPIILSSFVKLKINDSVLDVGSGVGAISLILKMKEKSTNVTAVDIDAEMCELCKRNSAINSLDIEIINVGIENLKKNPVLKDKLFDHVVTNPPFFEKKSSRVSCHKILANFETIDLSTWIFFCLKKLKNNGIFSIIHKASRVNDILCSLKNTTGAAEIIPIFPKNKNEAKRIVVQAKKSSKSETKILPGIVIRNDKGNYSDAMQEILSGNRIC